MKILTAAIALVLIGGATHASAQWQQGERPVADTPERKSVNGFAGHLLVVEDPRAFIEEWQKPETPKITPVSKTKRGVLLGAFVLFAGCKPDTEGRCNAEVDYVIYKPDGNVYAERKEQPLWKETAPPAPNIQLSRAILGIRMEKEDPPGVYTVKAKVTDRNAQISFELGTKFQLQ